MKFLAVLLLCILIFLSIFPGTAKPVPLTAKKTCCHDTAEKKTSHKKEAKDDDGCTKPNCTTLLTCSNCGFFSEQPLSIHPGYVPIQLKPVSLYKIGKLSEYHKADWKPPKSS